ncbi:arylamine N-acetyltransferase [Altericroceibacterium spongiae]|uniref:Arylamine N-acetyltransferase n=1 Tax=Altericroceibacterium spongiae TaxID=2320269 RepID=A0A420EIJ3_9SPHN|nr:arylamine N-acetyltransferase [Altericroceibacterium spongiae]RKF20541.1 arylamine N-acetyltransferase [Altericroceibacterium spongiae]
MTDRFRQYCDRIGLGTVPGADPSGLAQLQQAHRQAIAFENFDVMLGRPIEIDSETVFDKLVTRRRGGYCFEHNRLFSDMLSDCGIANRPLLARVLLGGAGEFLPARSHILLLANVDGEDWLADAGFGGSYVPPLPLCDGAEVQTLDGARHRLRRIGKVGALQGEWLLERAGPAEATDGRGQHHSDWQPQYSFDLAEIAEADLRQASHWASTVPGGRFSTLCIASIVLSDGFVSLSGPVLSVYGSGRYEKRKLAGRSAYRQALNDLLCISLSDEELSRLPVFAPIKA